MREIDDYIARFSPEIQRRLELIRSIAHDVFPGAEEKLRYGQPALHMNGKGLLWFGAYKFHIAVVAGYAITDLLRSQYPQYSYTKATVQLPHEEDFPGEFIREICGLVYHMMN